MKSEIKVEHHKEIDTFPYHIHLSNAEVISSSFMTLKKVLADIEKPYPLIPNRTKAGDVIIFDHSPD